MSFSDCAKGPADICFKNGSQIWVIPTKGTKPIRVVMENDYDMHEARGGPGNPTLLRWRHDDVFIYEDVSYAWQRQENDPAVDPADIENLL